MTSDDFRRLALSFPEATESAHMGHADFRVDNKIFATLPADGKGMVKLNPEQQDSFCREEPAAFTPVNGTWGKRGATYVILRAAKVDPVRRALDAAWRGTAPKRLAGQIPTRAQIKT